MTGFSIRHKTLYRYRHPVMLGLHRLQLRPRESRDLQVVSANITVSPSASIIWTRDVFGNAIASVSFPMATNVLIVESQTDIDLHSEPWPVFDISVSAISYPFSYSDDERLDLGACLFPQYADPDGRLQNWARGFVRGFPTDTLSLLKDMNASLSAWVTYRAHDDEGAQPPQVTLDNGWGSCRDMAVLLIEAVRRLGFGARIVSGYLAARKESLVGSADAGSTHAWAEIFVPGAGWVAFDPTNKTVGGYNLIPVAVARDIKQVVPVAGSFVGGPDDFLGMTVEVTVRET